METLLLVCAAVSIMLSAAGAVFCVIMFFKEKRKMLRIVIQGGMGINVSSPFLAKAAAKAGALGTVTGVGCERTLAYQLNLGDIGGHYRRALRHFPSQEVAQRILKKHFIEGGKAPDKDFSRIPMFSMKPGRDLIELTVAGSFCAVWLAKEGHRNPISINYLHKVQIPHPYHLLGAMLAGVNFVTMGAGIPTDIPDMLENLSRLETVVNEVYVEKIGGGYKKYPIVFKPRELFGDWLPKKLKKPGFLPIISSNGLADILVDFIGEERIYGFVVEGPNAGGHNAPPRGKLKLDELNQPIYGPRDEVDWKRLSALGIPFWIAGAVASPQAVKESISNGAIGVQVGSICALSEESGMDEVIAGKLRNRGYRHVLQVLKNALASPTGFPFQVAEVDDTISDPEIYDARERQCLVSALQFPFEMPDGRIGFRCASEPVDVYLKKGGKLEDTVGRKCLCHSLYAKAKMAHLAKGKDGELEKPIVTLGSDVSFLPFLMKHEDDTYPVARAIRWLTTGKAA